MRRRSEYNEIRILNEENAPIEMQQARERQPDPSETSSATESPSYREQGSLGTSSSSEKTGKRLHAAELGATSAKTLSTAVAAVAGSVVVGASVLPSLFSQKPTAQFLSLEATAREIFYEVDTENDEGLELILVVSDGEFQVKKRLDEDFTEGEIEDLKPNRTYTVSVMNGDDVLLTTTLKTEKGVQEVRELTWECRCAVDGYFYLQMSYLDEAEEWTNFRATLEDGYGNAAECLWGGEEETRLDVEGARLRGESATLVIEAWVQDGENSNWLEIYRESVAI